MPFDLESWKNVIVPTKEFQKQWFLQNFDPTAHSIWRVGTIEQSPIKPSAARKKLWTWYSTLKKSFDRLYGTMVFHNKTGTMTGYFVIVGQNFLPEIDKLLQNDTFFSKKVEASQYEEKKEEIVNYLTGYNFEKDDIIKFLIKSEENEDITRHSTCLFTIAAWTDLLFNAGPEEKETYLWENFDPRHYSIWRVDHKPPIDTLSRSDLQQEYESHFCDLCISVESMDSVSGILVYDDTSVTISGYFYISGQELPPKITNNNLIGFYTFQKIEPSQYEDKREDINRYIFLDNSSDSIAIQYIG